MFTSKGFDTVPSFWVFVTFCTGHVGDNIILIAVFATWEIMACKIFAHMLDRCADIYNKCSEVEYERES
jgi:hypothetical protein